MEGLSGIVLPVCLIALTAVILPLLLTPRGTRSQKRLMLSVALSALGLFVLGGVLFAFLYELRGRPVVYALGAEPVRVLGFLARRAAMASLIWAPLLMLAWLSLARRIEGLKSEDGLQGEGRGDGG